MNQRDVNQRDVHRRGHGTARALLLVATIAIASTVAPAIVDPASSRSAGAATPRTIRVTDAENRKVELDGPAKRIVVLEWVLAEDLLALGVTPVGVADIGGYRFWVPEPSMPKSSADVGTRAQPSLERIRALRPDVIVGVTDRHRAMRGRLEAIAPTVLFDPYPVSGDRVVEMRSTFTTLAQMVGRSARGTAVLDKLDADLAGAKARVTAAGLAQTGVALAQAGTSQGQVGARMFTANSMAVGVLDRIGLRNAWPAPPETYGFSQTEIEGFTVLGDVRFVYVPQSEKEDVVKKVFAGNPVWDRLPFVRAGHVYRLAPDTWLYGGPRSIQVFVHRLLAQLGA